MQIEILFFGKILELINKSKIVVNVDNDTQLINIINKINEKYPLLKNIQNIMYAVNNEYIYDYNIKINENDVIAYIPPISGG
tara:strand:- start:397 stop:642 length:246 start_codon:yes stop_codon:yes gene_type:complete